MSDVELFALAVLVQRETAMYECQFKQYGEQQADPITPASIALDSALRKREIIS